MSVATSVGAAGRRRAVLTAAALAVAVALLAGPSPAADAAVPPAYAPFSSWSALVSRQYTDLVNRAPSASERSTWVASLTSGAKTKGQLADSLRRSSENLSNVDPVVRIYRAFLGRAPDAGGLKFWIGRKRNVAPAKTWSVTQIAEYFTSSAEFKRKYGSYTNLQFVTAIYTDVLGRPSDPGGVAYWTNKLNTKTRTKAQVMVGFSESNEYKRKQAENTDVAVAYTYLLGRAPSGAEGSGWVSRQTAGTAHATLLGELLGSAAYSIRIAGHGIAPDRPSGISAAPGNARATVSWTAPASDGGEAITGYIITPYVGTTAQTPVAFNHTATTRTVTGLTNGTAYTFTVAAKNSVGTGEASTVSLPVTPTSVAPITTAIASGVSHTCAVQTGGTVACWGGNSQGQLGTGTAHDDPVPTPMTVAGVTDAVSVASAGTHTCALRSSGTVTCWGRNLYGQLGRGTVTSFEATPATVAGLTNVTSIAAGPNVTCAVISDGTLTCWGRNDTGQLGNGTTAESHTPKPVTGITSATAASIGYGSTCAVHGGGSVSCWGTNDLGQLGNGSTAPSITPVAVSGISDATSLASGDDSTCALRSGGSVRCWGRNQSGELGDGTRADSSTPVPVTGITDGTSLTAIDSYACARLSSGSVRCWGTTSALGNGSFGGSPSPVTVAELTTATAVAAGVYHTCALVSGGARCWGQNIAGNLGVEESVNSSVPVPAESISTASSVASGTNRSCAVLNDGGVACWGTAPWPQEEISTATAITTGDAQICALLIGGTVTCWGADPQGPVDGITTATAITAGGSRTCALLTGGTVSCWSAGASPATQPGITTATAVATSASQACAVLSGGTVTCWGSGAPALVPGITTATAVATSASHSCARLSNGTVRCWGSNGWGQLGDGTLTESAVPVPVSGIATATAITVGDGHTCAILSGGTATCWGSNTSGELGNGTTFNAATPVPVSEITTATSIAAGTNHTCARVSSSTLRCWGRGVEGQIGNSHGTYWSAPGSLIPF